jgi:hypothetical protein
MSSDLARQSFLSHCFPYIFVKSERERCRQKSSKVVKTALTI